MRNNEESKRHQYLFLKNYLQISIDFTNIA